MDSLNGNGAARATTTPAPMANGLPKIYTRREAAALIGKSPRLIDLLTSQGLLKKIQLPGRTRCAGISEASLRELVSGQNCFPNGGQ
jgi:hypothetical protein